MRVSTTFTCINVRAKTASSLPWGVFRENGRNKDAVTDSSVYWAIAQEANNYMTSANFWLLMTVWCDGWGEAFAYINRDSRMRPWSFDPWEPWCVDVRRENGDLWYSYKGGEWVPSREVLHFRWYTLDGIRGLSPILENQDVYGMAIKLKRYASLILGAQPPGVISYEGILSPSQMAENKKAWKEGPKGEVKVLSGKWKYDPIMTPGDEVQYNATKDGNEREQCAIYQMPPPFVQNFQRQTYSNAEQSDLSFAKHTMTPMATMYEKELNMKLFFEREKKTMFTKMNMNGLLRGDIAARQAFYQAMVNTGIMNRNEARSFEDMNPYEGGDDYLIQGAMKIADSDLLRKEMEDNVIPSAKPLNGKSLNGNHSYAN